MLHADTFTASPAYRLSELHQAIAQVPERRWPLCILTVCQVISDLDPECPMPLEQRRAVFDAIAAGQPAAAIAAMSGSAELASDLDQRAALAALIEAALGEHLAGSLIDAGDTAEGSVPGLGSTLQS